MPFVLQVWKVIRPIFISALSIFLSVLILNPLMIIINPKWDLLSNRGVGKITFIALIIINILIFISTRDKEFRTRWANINFYNIFFDKNFNSLKNFFLFFTIFFILHVSLLSLFWGSGAITITRVSVSLCAIFIIKRAGDFFQVFFLAWSEELIFRGTIYLYLERFFVPIVSALITSLIFMLSHDLTCPLNLITSHWELGLGLFLLGFLLNILFIVFDKLSVSMGAHAGLVFVKVLLRRIPIIIWPTVLPWWVDSDVRKSFFVHLVFVITLVILIYIKRKKIFCRRAKDV